MSHVYYNIIYHNGLFGLGSLDIIAISACDACPDLCSPLRNTRPTSAWYPPAHSLSARAMIYWLTAMRNQRLRLSSQSYVCAAKRSCTVPGATTPRTVFTSSASLLLSFPFPDLTKWWQRMPSTIKANSTVPIWSLPDACCRNIRWKSNNH